MEPREFANAIANGTRLNQKHAEIQEVIVKLQLLIDGNLVKGEKSKTYLREAIAILERQS